MPKYIFLSIGLSISLLTHAQKASIELDLYGRYDNHGQYKTRTGSNAQLKNMQTLGTSYGMQFRYLHPISEHFKWTAGIGYYRLGIDKVKTKGEYNLPLTSRSLYYDHPDGIERALYTDKYSYNNIDLSIGFRYTQQCKGNITFITGADINYYYTFSQKYRVAFDHAMVTIPDGRTLGFGVNGYFGIQKRFKESNYYVSPAILLPLYQQLNGDPAFRESNSIKNSKWLNGIGLSISIGKYILIEKAL